jgi:hypothetical protein
MDPTIRATLWAALLQSIRKPGLWVGLALGFSLGPLLWVLRNSGGIALQGSEAASWTGELARIGAWTGASAGLLWAHAQASWLEQWPPKARWRSEWALMAGSSVLLSGITSSFTLTQAPFGSPGEVVVTIGTPLLLGLHAGSLACAVHRLPLPGPWRIPAYLGLGFWAASFETASPALQRIFALLWPQPTLGLRALWATALATVAWGLLAGALAGTPRRR